MSVAVGDVGETRYLSPFTTVTYSFLVATGGANPIFPVANGDDN